MGDQRERVGGETLAEVSFTLELEDMAAFHSVLLSQQARQAWGRGNIRRLLTWAIASGAMSICIAIVAFNNHRTLVGPNLLIPVVVLLALVAYFWSRAAFTQHSSRSKSGYESGVWDLARQGYLRGDFSRQTIRISTEGLVQINRDGGSERRWSGIARIEDTASIFIIRLHESAAYPVPIRAFQSREAAYAFFDVCQVQIAAHKSHIDSAVVEFLAASEVACPGCNYTLRGLEDSKCPECGMQLNLGLLRMAAKSQVVVPSSR
ncbi:MAG: YcxB family protein [Phycisphaerales bacterium]|jgi:hypothetical protein